jgi:hypothetical protein
MHVICGGVYLPCMQHALHASVKLPPGVRSVLTALRKRILNHQPVSED